MTGPRLLDGVRQTPQVVPTGGDMDRLTERHLDPVRDLLARPFPVVVWWGLEAQIQRFTLDFVEQKGMVGATRTTVCQTASNLGCCTA